MKIIKVEFKDSCSEAIFCDITYQINEKIRRGFFKDSILETLEVKRTAYTYFFKNGSYCPNPRWCDTGEDLERDIYQAVLMQMILAYENSLKK